MEKWTPDIFRHFWTAILSSETKELRLYFTERAPSPVGSYANRACLGVSSRRAVFYSTKYTGWYYKSFAGKLLMVKFSLGVLKLHYFLLFSVCTRCLSGVQYGSKSTCNKHSSRNLWSWISLCRAWKTMVFNSEWRQFYIRSVWRWMLPGRAIN